MIIKEAFRPCALIDLASGFFYENSTGGWQTRHFQILHIFCFKDLFDYIKSSLQRILITEDTEIPGGTSVVLLLVSEAFGHLKAITHRERHE